MIDTELKAISDQVADLTRQVGKFVYKNWRGVMKVIDKDVADYQSNIDIEAEKMFAEGLKIILPEAEIQGEEIFTAVPKKNLKFVIDPIDGTRYFVSQSPSYCCQVALMDGDDVLLSSIYIPATDQIFTATKGFGAYLDGKKLEMSGETDPARAIVMAEWGNVEKGDEKMGYITKLFENCKRIYIGTGGMIPFVATKTYDAYVRIHHQYKIHDLAPRICLWKEAGAKVEMIPVGNTKVMIAANPVLYDNLFDLITK